MQNRYAIAAKALRNRCESAAQSHLNRIKIAAQSLVMQHYTKNTHHTRLSSCAPTKSVSSVVPGEWPQARFSNLFGRNNTQCEEEKNGFSKANHYF
jgi:hypothetical protein